MKKITAILLGTLIASSAALAQTNQVLSRNAVGYIKTSLASNKLYLVSNPFVGLTEQDGLITNMLASVPNGSAVNIWQESSQSYLTFLKNARGSWTGTGVSTAKISRADAFFVRSGGTGTVFFMGEVPDTTTAPTTVQSRATGLTMIGYPYPVEVALTGTPAGVNLPAGGVISMWNSDSQSYASYLKNARGAWAGTYTVSVKPGEGLIIRATNAPSSISTTKPYIWP